MLKTARDIDIAIGILIEKAWPRIAASGWNRYQQYGRGALVASFGMFEGKSETMNYLTPPRHERLSADLASAIEHYDPSASVVLVFVENAVYESLPHGNPLAISFEDEGLLRGLYYVKVVTNTPSPPDCANQVAH